MALALPPLEATLCYTLTISENHPTSTVDAFQFGTVNVVPLR
jgi:hypothetical protein